ncbi:hypothetical protein K490DRAFT_61175 [Saccharata proteae CBS 121410]|uniref:Ribosomal protein S21 n=1 Tax=Saccharata proteae CBS 121410 TaxID=1314787 RepID=A0A9P4HYS6_9PEZI|nr:hypothetical protein K490DRAFT_61175 [Saccharata proteae CBS 121410]
MSSTVRSYPHRLPATLNRALCTPDAAIPGTKRTLTSSARFEQSEPPRNSKSSSTQQRSPAPKDDNIEGMLNSIFPYKFGKPGTSRYKSRPAQAENRATTGSGPGSEISADSGTTSVQDAFTARQASINRPRTDMSSAIDTMFQPEGSGSVEDRSYLTTPPRPEELSRVGPSVGKSVSLNTNRGQSFADGLRLLDTLVARNGVRYDLKKQAFHERPGLKRKRLARERWRKRFMTGFKQVVSRVQRLRKQGW